ncbi:MAG: nitroreductase family protein [Thermoproteota archaeon]
MEAIKTRRSIRRYADREVERALVVQALDAARHAPSASNIQPWEFVVITDTGTKEKLSRVHKHSAFLKGAPVVVVVLGNERLSEHHFPVDCAAAIENLLLAAHGLGLGCCWVAVYSTRSTEREEAVRGVLEVGEEYRIVAMVGMGYPGEVPKPRKMKELDEIVHWGSFRSPN